MNHWKHWPAWVKGGSIAGLVGFLFVVFQFVLVPNLFYGICDGYPCMFSWAKLIEGLFGASMTPLWNSPLARLMFDYQVVYVVFALLYYFVIGAFFGLMYEKWRGHSKN